MAMIKQYMKKNGEKAWYFKTYLGIDPLTKKKKYTTKRGFKTQKEAKLALSRLELEIETNGVSDKSSSATFKDVYDLWIEHYKSDVKKVHYREPNCFLTNIFCQNLVIYPSKKLQLHIAKKL